MTKHNIYHIRPQWIFYLVSLSVVIITFVQCGVK